MIHWIDCLNAMVEMRDSPVTQDPGTNIATLSEKDDKLLWRSSLVDLYFRLNHALCVWLHVFGY